MSLVNRVLRDLEDRHAFLGTPPHAALSDLRSAQDYAQADEAKHRRGLLAGAGLLVIVAVMVLAARPQPASMPVLPEVAPSAIAPAAAPAQGPVTGNGLQLKLDQLPAFVDAPAASPAPEAPIAAAPRVLYVNHESGAFSADIAIAVTSRPVYTLNLLSGPERLLVELQDAGVSGSLTQGFVPAGLLAGLREGRGDDTLRLVFDLAQPVVLDGAELQESGDHYELHVHLTARSATPEAIAALAGTPAAAPASASAAPAGVIRRSADAPAPAEAAFREGLAAYRSGDVAAAIESLHRALTEDPSHAEARRVLVGVLVEQGDAASAKRLAAEGLEREPTDSVLAKAYARILLQDGEVESALAILARAAPPLESDPDFYALTAAALQQQGRHPQALEVYNRLLRLDANKGAWWAGFGISLDALGRSGEAVQAFRRAQRDSTVPVPLRRYAAERIAVLQGEAN